MTPLAVPGAAYAGGVTARVIALHVAGARRAPMLTVERVDAEEGRGLVGDRYHGTRHRHVSVQSLDDLDAAAHELGAPVRPGQTRRNVTLDAGPVPVTPGARLVVGDVLLEVVRPAAPCPVMDTSVAPGARRALHGRGGAVCRVLRSGSIRVGDDAVLDPRLLADASAAVDAPSRSG